MKAQRYFALINVVVRLTSSGSYICLLKLPYNPNSVMLESRWKELSGFWDIFFFYLLKKLSERLCM